MNNEQINIAIAEACGWKDLENEDFSEYGVPCFMLMGSNNTGTRLAPPDYCNDLNAMNEAEKVLSPANQPARGESQWSAYLGWLGFCGENNTSEVYGCVTATASQRAEAFLKTLGKWEETK